MKKYISFILATIILSGCKVDKIKLDQVINKLVISDKKPLADGGTIVDISVELNGEADPDKRNVVFKSTGGTFLVTNESSITQKAVYENQALIARVKLKIPPSPGTITITALPEIRSVYQDYILTDSLKSSPSLPSSIAITPSSFSVFTGFAGEIQITGLLKNGGNNVSTNSKVIFEDYDLNRNPIHGRYRLKKDKSDASSTVSTMYSPGFLPVGSSFYVKCTYIDQSGNKTNVKDSCLITVTQP